VPFVHVAFIYLDHVGWFGRSCQNDKSMRSTEEAGAGEFVVLKVIICGYYMGEILTS
jgi:hypothetical protein